MSERGFHFCRKCNRSLPVAQFWTDTHTKELRNSCKKCMRQYSTEWLRRKKMNHPATVEEKPVKDESGNPACPKCKGATNKLNSYGGRTLYECTKFACGEQFSKGEAPPAKPPPSIPRRMATPPDVEAEPSEPEEEKEKPMAKEFQCEECGAVFGVPQALGAHRRFQHGGAKKSAAVNEDPTGPEAGAARNRPTRPPKVTRSSVARFDFSDAIGELKRKRDLLIEDFVAKNEEVAAIDTAIEALEKVR